MYQVNQLLSTLQLTEKFPVYEVALGLTGIKTPNYVRWSKSYRTGTMREDTILPSYVVCGARLTNLASAYLMDPESLKNYLF